VYPLQVSSARLMEKGIRFIPFKSGVYPLQVSSARLRPVACSLWRAAAPAPHETRLTRRAGVSWVCGGDACAGVPVSGNKIVFLGIIDYLQVPCAAHGDGSYPSHGHIPCTRPFACPSHRHIPCTRPFRMSLTSPDKSWTSCRCLPCPPAPPCRPMI
jgi:hypothetical protein